MSAATVRIFLVDGTADGPRIVEKSNWTGIEIVCARHRFADVKSRPELERAGVYALWGASEDDRPVLYIGEGDPALPRLDQHRTGKDFWHSFALFTSRDGHLNKAHIQYLEARLIALAQQTGRCELVNRTDPQLPSMSEVDGAEAEDFLRQILLIVPMIGLDVFEKRRTVPSPRSVTEPRPNVPAESPPLKHSVGSSIRAEGGRYVTARNKMPVSNFTLRIVHSFRPFGRAKEQGTLREVELCGEDGKTSAIGVRADDKISPKHFAAWCAGLGNFVWRGGARELNDLWMDLIRQESGQVVNLPDHVGQIEGKPFSLWGNALIQHDGKIILPDASGILWTAGEGWRTPRTDPDPPRLGLEGGLDLGDLEKKMVLAAGAQAARLGLGWAAATLFSDLVHREQGCFPILFISGGTGALRSELAGVYLSLLGLSGKLDDGRGATPSSILRKAAYYSNLAFGLDGALKLKALSKGDRVLESIFSRDRSAGETPIRGTLLLCGEERPADASLPSCLLEIPLGAIAPDQETLEWLKRQTEALAGFPALILTRRADFASRFPGMVETARGTLRKKWAASRAARAYAIAVAGYSWAFGKPIEEATKNVCRIEMDTLSEFIEECCELNKYARVKASGLYDAYKKWCDKSGEYQLTQKRFGTQLGERGYEKIKSNGIWYLGISLQTDDEKKQGIALNHV